MLDWIVDSWNWIVLSAEDFADRATGWYDPHG